MAWMEWKPLTFIAVYIPIAICQWWPKRGGIHHPFDCGKMLINGAMLQFGEKL